jgi:hypothetical protein
MEISFHVFSDINVRKFQVHSPTAFSRRKTHGSEKRIVPILVQNVEPRTPTQLTYSGNKRRVNNCTKADINALCVKYEYFKSLGPLR